MYMYPMREIKSMAAYEPVTDLSVVLFITTLVKAAKPRRTKATRMDQPRTIPLKLNAFSVS